MSQYLFTVIIFYYQQGFHFIMLFIYSFSSLLNYLKQRNVIGCIICQVIIFNENNCMYYLPLILNSSVSVLKLAIKTKLGCYNKAYW